MGNLQMQMVFRREVSAPLLVQSPVTLLKQGDSDANVLIVDLYDKGEAADASGHTVSGYLLRADGNRVPLEGSVAGNRVTVQMNKHCYLVPGPYGAFVRLVKGDFKRTILEIAGEVESEGNGPVVDVNEKFITIEEVIEQIEAARQATEAADDAAQKADNSAENANSAAGTANNAAQTANSAAARANTAAASVEGMTVSSEDVGPGTQASAQISSADGKKHIHFKLRQGATGATPDITFRVATGAPGTQAEIQQSGTPENPIIDLTIPRGDTGAVDGIDYYAGSPEALGTASPGTANGLARGDHVHPMPSAADVGARPSDWIPSVSDIAYLGVNPIASVDSDTTSSWCTLGSGYAFYQTNGLLLDQPNQYGIVVSYVIDSDVFQFWKSQASGPLYYRSGNNNGWGNSWTKLIGEDSLINTVYPVGSIYLSVNSTSPASLFGGTWEQLKDRFLLGAGSSYTAGNTGGAATHKLTVDEMPSHNHSYSRGPLFYDEVTDTTNCLSEASSTSTLVAGSTGYKGGSQAHNNMPPYLVVYMWKRVS